MIIRIALNNLDVLTGSCHGSDCLTVCLRTNLGGVKIAEK